MDIRSLTTTDFNFPKQKSVYHGKVRDVYILEDQKLISIATDRISAFDVILPRPIPHKGQILNQIAEHFLKATSDIAPNWLEAVPDPNVSYGKLAEPYKVEVVVRGLLVGHAWREYSAGKRQLAGAQMADNLQEYDAFPSPIITPTTKADAGHDEDISEAEIVANGVVPQSDWVEIKSLALKLFARGQQMAEQMGLILADTKYEFGNYNGQIILIDEVHTPDSSRYFNKQSYETYLADRDSPKPEHLSKEFVREWLIANDFMGKPGQEVPNMDDEFVNSVSQRYQELFEQVTGKKFEPADVTNISARIENNVTNYLKGAL